MSALTHSALRDARPGALTWSAAAEPPARERGRRTRLGSRELPACSSLEAERGPSLRGTKSLSFCTRWLTPPPAMSLSSWPAVTLPAFFKRVKIGKEKKIQITDNSTITLLIFSSPTPEKNSKELCSSRWRNTGSSPASTVISCCYRITLRQQAQVRVQL